MFVFSSEIVRKMENIATYNLSISKLNKHFPGTHKVSVGDDFCLIDLKLDTTSNALPYPCRFDGILMLYCVKGSVKMSVNLDEYDINDNSLIICSPNNILKLTEVRQEDGEPQHYVLIAMSQQFASELRIDFKRMISESVALIDVPVVTLPDNIKNFMGRYLSLIADVVETDMEHKDAALRSLVSSMLCTVAGVWKEKINEMKITSLQSTTRSRMIFEQFIRLVSEYHTKYRNVGFYAEKLCLTPKYLSKLIKNASGRSAPEWIDSYVILEAKNLLKYSDISIKEIVYRLNFPNQSVFYKFFKARTGMTPSGYRNS